MIKLKTLLKEWNDTSFKDSPKRWSKPADIFRGESIDGLTEFENLQKKHGLQEELPSQSKRSLENAFRSVYTGISMIEREMKIITKTLNNNKLQRSAKELRMSWDKNVMKKFVPDAKNISQQHYEENIKEKFPASSLGHVKWSNDEAAKISQDSVNKAAKAIGKAQQLVVSIFTSDMKNGRYDNLDLSKAINTGNIKDASMSKRDVLQQLYYDVRDRFTKLGKRKK